MAFGSTLTLPHGLGALSFKGIIKLKNGKIVLWTTTTIYEMPDEVSAAASIHSAGFTLGVGTAGLDADGLDRVVIGSPATDDFAVISYSGGGSPTVVEDTSVDPLTGTLMATFGSSEFAAAAFLAHTDGTAIKVTALAGGAYADSACGTLREAFEQNVNEVVGTALRPAEANTGSNRMDLTDLGSWQVAADLTYGFLGGLDSGSRVYAGHFTGVESIIGGALGKVATSVFGQDTLPAANGVLSVYRDTLNSLWHAAVSDGATDSDVYYSADGDTWLTGTITAPAINPLDFGRVVYSTTGTAMFLMDRGSGDDADGDPEFTVWRSVAGIIWTDITANFSFLATGVVGFIPTDGEVLQLNVLTGEIDWSGDDGTTFAGTPFAAIPVADARKIRHIKEVSLGVIAWGGDVVYFSPFGATHTDPWKSLRFPEGVTISTVREDSGDLFVHSKRGTFDHYDTWAMDGYDGDWQDWFQLGRGVNGQFPDPLLYTPSSGAPIALVAIEANEDGMAVVGSYTRDGEVVAFIAVTDGNFDEIESPEFHRAITVLDVDPLHVLYTDHYVVVSDADDIAAVRREFVSETDPYGWQDFVAPLRDQAGATQSIVRLVVDGDVMIALCDDGPIFTSDNGREWFHVLTVDPDIFDGHAVVV